MSIQFSDDTMAEKFIQMAENVATIKEKLEELPAIKEKVDKHERAYTVGKFLGVPALGAFHLGVKHILTKLGL